MAWAGDPPAAGAAFAGAPPSAGGAAASPAGAPAAGRAIWICFFQPRDLFCHTWISA